MALVVGLKEGEDLFFSDRTRPDIDHARVILKEILTPTRCKILVETLTIDHKLEIDDTRATKIIPNVTMQAGQRGSMQSMKLAIEAPRNIVIERGAWRRRQQDT